MGQKRLEAQPTTNVTSYSEDEEPAIESNSSVSSNSEMNENEFQNENAMEVENDEAKKRLKREAKRARAREYYAKNKDKIKLQNKQSKERKKLSKTVVPQETVDTMKKIQNQIDDAQNKLASIGVKSKTLTIFPESNVTIGTEVQAVSNTNDDDQMQTPKEAPLRKRSRKVVPISGEEVTNIIRNAKQTATNVSLQRTETLAVDPSQDEELKCIPLVRSEKEGEQQNSNRFIVTRKGNAIDYKAERKAVANFLKGSEKYL